MYVLLPFLFVWFCNKRSFWPVAIPWLSSVVLAIIQPSAPGLSRISILRFMPNFLAGLIAFNLPRVQRLRAFFWPLLLAGLIAIFTLNPAPTTGWILCLILGLAVPFFAEITTPWIRVVSKHIATYSYGIYMSHQFSIWISLGGLGSQSHWLTIPVLSGLRVLLPILLDHGIEKPMIQLGARVANNRDLVSLRQKEPVATAA
jgi:hypothetical protein